MRNGNGTFAAGNPGGPGRGAKISPLTKAISDDEACLLWRAEYNAATGGDAEARRFILTHKHGRPAQSFPDVPAIAWARVTCVADLAGSVQAMLGAHEAGQIDSAGLDFLTEMIGKLAKVFEAVELGPKVKRIEEHLAAQAAMQGANG